MTFTKITLSLLLLLGLATSTLSWGYGAYSTQPQQSASPAGAQMNPQQMAAQIQMLNQQVQSLRGEVQQLKTKVQQLQQSQASTDQRLKPVENFQKGYMGKPYIKNP